MRALSARVADRKNDHIRLALMQQQETKAHRDYDDIEFLYHALEAINPERVDLSTCVAGKTWRQPLYVNAMTGGTSRAAKINRAIAMTAAETGIAIASGSVGAALDYPELAPSFRVLRELNPDGFVFANIGAGRNLADAQRAVDLLQADALQIHLNAVQETVMPEGERNFESWLPLLSEITNRLSVPVVVKEVGCGLSRRTLNTLRNIGVQIADVSGFGGTNFASIEAARGDDEYYELNGFGQSAVCNLLDAPDFETLLASGGVQNPLDAVKLLALGAQGVGVAGAFLKYAEDDPQLMIERVKLWERRMRDIAALLGAKDIAALKHTDVLIRGRVREYCQLRSIDPTGFARRGADGRELLDTAAEGLRL